MATALAWVNAGNWRGRSVWLVAPALILLLTIFIYPVGSLLLRSLSEPAWGLQNFKAIAAQPVYLRALANTVVISGSVTLICLLGGYPRPFVLGNLFALLDRPDGKKTEPGKRAADAEGSARHFRLNDDERSDADDR